MEQRFLGVQQKGGVIRCREGVGAEAADTAILEKDQLNEFGRHTELSIYGREINCSVELGRASSTTKI